MNTRRWKIAVAVTLTAVWIACLIVVSGSPRPPSEPGVVAYDAAFPNLQCLDGRVIAETDAGLTDAGRAQLWADYGLAPGFEWINPGTQFTYHELEVRTWSPADHLLAWAAGRTLAPRGLRPLVELLCEDARINWAAPDALILEWADQDTVTDEMIIPAQSISPATKGPKTLPPGEELLQEEHGGYGVSLLSKSYTRFNGTLGEWAALRNLPDPYPDFEYYRICEPDGTRVTWAEPLAGNETFAKRYELVFGTAQARALSEYRAAGSPRLAPLTICVADTGVLLHHPDLAGRLHPNGVDANYRNYAIAPAGERPGENEAITDRWADSTAGMPRQAVRDRPASHGTAVAGILARCTAGFETETGPVRLLPASIRSERTLVFTGYKVKSPISSFIKLVACLNENFPVGDVKPGKGDEVQNTGDVRVVSISASVPKSMFSDAEWRVVANLAGKAAGTIMEDLLENDRLYVFAAGNEAQGEPNKPGDMDYVLAVSATQAYDGSKAWEVPVIAEGSNMGTMCVSAPGHGIITSDLYVCANLKYLPAEEIDIPHKSFSTPPRDIIWEKWQNDFGATSSATPQVAALGALLYAQEPKRDYTTVIQLIRHSVRDRRNIAPWGESMGIIDYAQALGWME